jgi:hypothetical protein
MNYPITPPPELVRQWTTRSLNPPRIGERDEVMATLAARWGADQELEACCELMDDWGLEASDLRAARRPKPPSLKLPALKAISRLLDGAGRSADNSAAAATIRRALEALPDD